MFPLLLAGLPALINGVGGLLGMIDNPVAKTAAQAMTGVTQAIANGDITPEQMKQANTHAEEMARIAANQQTAEQEQVSQTYRAEVESQDGFVRRMRPTFGYAMALTWVVQMGAVSYAIIFEPSMAVQLIASLSSLTGLWGIALAVLGIYTYGRTQEKKAVMSGDADAIKSVPATLGNIVGTAWSSATSKIAR